MICGLDELRCKEVIDISTGERLGSIDDAELDLASSRVVSLVIYGRLRLFGLLGREDDIVVSCSDIKVIGHDVVLVERQSSRNTANSTKMQKNGTKSLLK